MFNRRFLAFLPLAIFAAACGSTSPPAVTASEAPGAADPEDTESTGGNPQNSEAGATPKIHGDAGTGEVFTTPDDEFSPALDSSLPEISDAAAGEPQEEKSADSGESSETGEPNEPEDGGKPLPVVDSGHPSESLPDGSEIEPDSGGESIPEADASAAPDATVMPESDAGVVNPPQDAGHEVADAGTVQPDAGVLPPGAIACTGVPGGGFDMPECVGTSTPKCHPAKNYCVQCVFNEQCPKGNYCDKLLYECRSLPEPGLPFPCSADIDCGEEANRGSGKYMCEPQTKTCVDCLKGYGCVIGGACDEQTHYCYDPTPKCDPPCPSDELCVRDNVCDKAGEMCDSCRKDSDCLEPGAVCWRPIEIPSDAPGKCTAPCKFDKDCKAFDAAPDRPSACFQHGCLCVH